VDRAGAAAAAGPPGGRGSKTGGRGARSVPLWESSESTREQITCTVEIEFGRDAVKQ
jgi:hypothetical protein